VRGLDGTFYIYSYQGGENESFSHIILLDCFSYVGVSYAQLIPAECHCIF
jgi:hypothetical protein